MVILKRDFFQTVAVSIILYHIDANKTHREKARWELYKNSTSYNEAFFEIKTKYHL